jgi:hypothetical protein
MLEPIYKSEHHNKILKNSDYYLFFHELAMKSEHICSNVPLIANTVLWMQPLWIHRFVAASFLFRPAAGGEGDKEATPCTKQGAGGNLQAGAALPFLKLKKKTISDKIVPGWE